MDREKFVDESWKENAKANDVGASDSGEKCADDCGCHSEQNGEAAGSATDLGGQGAFELNFLNYITSLGFQAMIFLGEIPSPVTNEVEKNIEQAKFLIDTLVMLREKTKGNLNPQEDNLLNASIYELQLRFVEVAKGEGPQLHA